jgi:tellurite resistance protein
MSAEKPSFFKKLPVSAFAMVMGLSGLTLLWARVANLGWAAAFAYPLAAFFAGLVSVVFVLFLALYIRKWVASREQVHAEWQHPVKSSFFAAISVSFGLMAAVAVGAFAPLAEPLWIIGAVLQAIAMAMMVNAWVHRESLQPGHASPPWFIPAVGNVVMPLAGVRLGFVEVSWWFFGVGVVFWIVLLTVVLHRLLFVQPALPQRLTPTLCILLAPPAVSFLSWLQLTGQHPGAAELSPVGHVLYGVALFFAIFLLSQFKRFAKLPFYLSWWAFSFPTAAFATATLVYAQFMPTLPMQAWAVFMLGFTTVLILGLLIRTVIAVARAEPEFTD